MNKILGGFLAIFLLQTSASAADKIRIAYPAAQGIFLTLPMAQREGFFREQGIDVELIQIRGPAAVRAALLNGQIDYYPGIGSMVSAAIGGTPVEVVACYVPATPTVLIAQPKFKSVQDLKGKTIMVGGVGSDPHIITQIMLKHFGINPENEVKFVFGPPPEACLAAVKQEIVAATVAPPPFDLRAKKLGLRILARAPDLFSYPVAGLVATKEKIASRPDEVKRVIEAGLKANQFILRERDLTIQFMEAWLKLDRETAAATYDSTRRTYSENGNLPADGFQLVIDAAERATKVNRRVYMGDIADLSILKRAQRETGIAR